MAMGFYCDLTPEERLRKISRLVNKGIHLYYQKTNGKMEEQEKEVVKNQRKEQRIEINMEHKEYFHDEILTIKEAMSFLKISRTTFWRLRKQIGVPCVLVGKRLIRFKLSDILKYLSLENN